MFLVYLGIALVMIYSIIMCWHMNCIPPSISETYYHGGGLWFTLTLFVSSILIMMGLLDISDGSPWQFVSFFTAAGMAFVGAAPHIHSSERTIHAVAASILMAGSQIWLSIFSTPWLLLFWCVLPLYWNCYSRIFWIEITCLFSMAVGLLLV